MVEAGPVVVSADDYGLSEGVSAAICALIAQGRLSATACMTVFPEWPHHARALEGLEEHADIGLHLTLTDHVPLTGRSPLAPAGRLPSLGRLAAAAMRRRLPCDALDAEIRAQLDAFTQVRGHLPLFVDGHHHVHGLPGVHEALARVLGDALDTRRVGVRDCWENPQRVVARAVAVPRALAVAGLTRSLHRVCQARGWACNDGFAGIHDFRSALPYRALFRRFLAPGGLRPLIGCHPGQVDDTLRARDPLAEPREAEFAYLASPAFLDDLDAAGRRLGRWRDLLAAGGAAGGGAEGAAG